MAKPKMHVTDEKCPFAFALENDNRHFVFEKRCKNNCTRRDCKWYQKFKKQS